MISASVTTTVPWGFVCGYPTRNGDLYGGAHYLQSSSADLTLQGRAIRDASNRFGNGQTLPYTPCKKGFVPHVNGERRYACPLHNQARRKRVLTGDGPNFRAGELDLHVLWKRYEEGESLSSKDNPISSQESKQSTRVEESEQD